MNDGRFRRLRADIRSIGSDNRSGALSLSRKAAAALLRFAEQLPDGRFHPALERAGRELVSAQPAMAPIFHLANAVLLAADGCEDGREARTRVRAECRNFLLRLEGAGAQIGRHAAPLIRNGAMVLTHSASETVLRALAAAWQAGKRFEVVCTESRPVCEGRAMARALATRGIPVTLIVDAAMLRHLERAAIALAGADSVSTRGLVNKTGTSLLAAGARQLRVPLYALCDSAKLLPEGRAPLPEAPKNPREVLPRRIAGVTVENFYFDRTPLDRLTGVITEDGILKPSELRRCLGRMRIHPALAGLED